MVEKSWVRPDPEGPQGQVLSAILSDRQHHALVPPLAVKKYSSSGDDKTRACRCDKDFDSSIDSHCRLDTRRHDRTRVGTTKA